MSAGMICANSAALDAYERRQHVEDLAAELANKQAHDIGVQFLADMTAGRWGSTYDLPQRINTIGHGPRLRTMTCADWAQNYFGGCGQAEIDQREMLRLIAKLAEGPVGVLEHISAKAIMARCVRDLEDTAADAIAEAREVV